MRIDPPVRGTAGGSVADKFGSDPFGSEVFPVGQSEEINPRLLQKFGYESILVCLLSFVSVRSALIHRAQPLSIRLRETSLGVENRWRVRESPIFLPWMMRSRCPRLFDEFVGDMCTVIYGRTNKRGCLSTRSGCISRQKWVLHEK